jgi:3-oxoadipate enol-lactonase
MEVLKSPDGSTTALRAGRGRDMVILHSLLTDRDAFQAVASELTAKFRVTLINLPGFHRSAKIPGDLVAYQTWLGKALDGFAIGPDCILCGNGFGGTVALAFALSNQQRIGKLLLVDVAPGFPEQGKAAFRLMAEKAATEGMSSIAPIAARRVYHASYVEKNPTVIEERRRVLAEIDPGAFAAACEALIHCDLAPRLNSLKVPTLIVYGALDQATPPELNGIIAKNVSGSRVIEMPECGHCPPLEKPAEFLDGIRPFLS